MQYDMEQYKTIQYNKRQDETSQTNLITYKTIHYKTRQATTRQFKSTLNSTRLYNIIQDYITQDNSIIQYRARQAKTISDKNGQDQTRPCKTIQYNTMQYTFK